MCIRGDDPPPPPTHTHTEFLHTPPWGPPSLHLPVYCCACCSTASGTGMPLPDFLSTEGAAVLGRAEPSGPVTDTAVAAAAETAGLQGLEVQAATACYTFRAVKKCRFTVGLCPTMLRAGQVQDWLCEMDSLCTKMYCMYVQHCTACTASTVLCMHATLYYIHSQHGTACTDIIVLHVQPAQYCMYRQHLRASDSLTPHAHTTPCKHSSLNPDPPTNTPTVPDPPPHTLPCLTPPHTPHLRVQQPCARLRAEPGPRPQGPAGQPT